MSEKTIAWYNCHNFNTQGDVPKCSKCGRIEKYPEKGWESVKQTVCPIKSATDAKTAYKEHGWVLLPPETETYIEYKPFHVIALKFEDLL